MVGITWAVTIRRDSDDDSDHRSEDDATGTVDQAKPKERRNYTNNKAAGRSEYVENTWQRIRFLFPNRILLFHVSHSYLSPSMLA